MESVDWMLDLWRSARIANACQGKLANAGELTKVIVTQTLGTECDQKECAFKIKWTLRDKPSRRWFEQEE